MTRWSGRLGRLAICLAAGAAPAAAQCSMCRTALAAHSGEVFNRAILILLLPAMVLFSGTFLLVYRLYRADDDDPLKTGSQDGETAGEEACFKENPLH